MYGISNSQQQGGGGGSAASYKAIKSTLTPNDWQEVAGATPYFVGENAMTWAVSAGTGMPTKSQPTNIGLVAGNSYTITVVADNETYTSISEAVGGAGGVVRIMFRMSNTNVYVYDKWDAATMSPAAQGSMCAVEARATSLVITNFEGEGFGKSIQATISDSAIKVNSAVTMYTNTSEKIAVGEKTNGNVTLIAPSIPETEISYSLEIVGTDTEGLFEIINGYIPEIPDTPSGVPQWHTIFESETPVVSAEVGQNIIQPGQLYRITVDMSGEATPDQYEVYTATAPDDYYIPFSQINARSSSVDVSVFRLEYTSSGSRNVHLSPIAHYEVTSEGIKNFVAMNNVDAWKFTKVEVYR